MPIIQTTIIHDELKIVLKLTKCVIFCVIQLLFHLLQIHWTPNNRIISRRDILFHRIHKRPCIIMIFYMFQHFMHANLKNFFCFCESAVTHIKKKNKNKLLVYEKKKITNTHTQEKKKLYITFLLLICYLSQFSFCVTSLTLLLAGLLQYALSWKTANYLSVFPAFSYLLVPYFLSLELTMLFSFTHVN